MDTESPEPVCVMSRSKGSNKITTGARSFRYIEETRPSKTRRIVDREPKIKKQKPSKEPRVPSQQEIDDNWRFTMATAAVTTAAAGAACSGGGGC